MLAPRSAIIPDYASVRPDEHENGVLCSWQEAINGRFRPPAGEPRNAVAVGEPPGCRRSVGSQADKDNLVSKMLLDLNQI